MTPTKVTCPECQKHERGVDYCPTAHVFFTVCCEVYVPVPLPDPDDFRDFEVEIETLNRGY